MHTLEAGRELDHGGPENSFEPWPPSALDEPAFARFQSMVRRYPQRIAVTGTDGEWTYDALERLALRVAAHLQQGDGPVAVVLAPGGPLAAAFLACLATGRPCVPLDPDYPASRNRQLLQHAGASIAISDRMHQQLLPDGLACLDIGQCAPKQATALHGASDSIAWILYTSGSTGRPKGVFQNQRGLLQDIFEYTHSIHLSAGDELTGLYSPSVAGALRDIYGALFNGAGLHFLQARALGFEGLAAQIQKRGITVFHMIPPLLRAFLRSRPAPGRLASVRLAYLAGDRIFSADIRDFYAFFQRNVIIYTGIGSTENATLFRQWFVTADTRLDGPLLPVGHAIPGRELRVVDGSGHELPPGEVGELETASRWLAQGYWRDEPLTRSGFWDDGRAGWRRFRSGDLGFIRADGLLELLGRNDSRVKIRGYPVELSLIEAFLREQAGVEDAAVAAREIDGEMHIFAWLVGSLDLSALRRALEQQLPPQQIPGRLYRLAEIPRLPAFKLDRQALFSLADAEITAISQTVQGSDGQLDLQQRVSVCWRKVLRLSPETPLLHSFADSGGDSLAMLALQAMLQHELGDTVPNVLLHAGLKCEELVDLLLRRNTAGGTLFVIYGPLGGATGLQAFAGVLAPELAVVELLLPSLEQELRAPMDFDALVVHVSDVILQQAGKGAIHLMGLSWGGKLVVQVALQLIARGRMPGEIIVGDTPALAQPEPGLQRWRRRVAALCGLEETVDAATAQRSRFARLGFFCLIRTARCLPPALLRPVHRRLQQHVPARYLLPVEIQLLMDRRIRLCQNWRAPWLPLRLTLISNECRPGRDPARGWIRCASELRIIQLPGAHLGFLRPAQLPGFARLLRDLLLPAAADTSAK